MISILMVNVYQCNNRNNKHQYSDVAKRRKEKYEKQWCEENMQ